MPTDRHHSALVLGAVMWDGYWNQDPLWRDVTSLHKHKTQASPGRSDETFWLRRKSHYVKHIHTAWAAAANGWTDPKVGGSLRLRES